LRVTTNHRVVRTVDLVPEIADLRMRHSENLILSTSFT
jgi:hypothetical protein